MYTVSIIRTFSSHKKKTVRIKMLRIMYTTVCYMRVLPNLINNKLYFNLVLDKFIKDENENRRTETPEHNLKTRGLEN